MGVVALGKTGLFYVRAEGMYGQNDKILIQKFYELSHNIWLFIIIQREKLNATKVKVWIQYIQALLLF